MTEEKKDYQIKMPNVRLSFPNLFQTSTFGGEDTGKFDATFILDKTEHAQLIKDIGKKIKALIVDKLKKKSPGAERVCLKDGDETDREELQGCYYIKASTKKRPMILDRDKTPVTEDDGVIYSGCYVNGICTLWAQDNSYGKRVNASLDGVMFSQHGEPFGAPAIDADEFDAFGSADDDANVESMPF